MIFTQRATSAKLCTKHVSSSDTTEIAANLSSVSVEKILFASKLYVCVRFSCICLRTHTYMPVQAMAQSAQKQFASEERKHHVLVRGHGWNVCVDSGVYCVQQVYMTVCRARTGVCVCSLCGEAEGPWDAREVCRWSLA